VPDGRTRTRPRPWSAGLLALHCAQDALILHCRCQRWTILGYDVDQPLGQLRHRVALLQVPSAERFEREQCAGDPVAGGTELEVDDVPGLLAAERPAPSAELIEHVAIADRRGRHLDAGLGHRGVEAEVRHHGHSNPIGGQLPPIAEMDRSEGHELISIDHLSRTIDRQHPVAVAVEGRAGLAGFLVNHGFSGGDRSDFGRDPRRDEAPPAPRPVRAGSEPAALRAS